MADNMYFDTDTFNFDDLVDVVEMNDEQKDAPAPKAPSNPDGGVVDDISDLIGNDVEQEEEEVEEDEPEDEESEDESEDEAEEAEEPSEEEVDFEDYQITLPNGEEVTLSDLVKGYKDNSALEEAITEFQQTQEEFVEKSASVGKLLELARLEADRVIEDYEGFDWSSYKRDDPAGYVENREFLDRYIARRKEIIENMERLDADKAKTEQEAKAAAAVEAGAVLQRDIPGWNKDLYVELMDFAIANGADKEAIEQSTDPVMFKMLYKALQFEKGKQIVKAKVKRVGSPTKVAKPSAKPVERTDVNPAKKVLMKKLRNGGLTQAENAKMFDFLVD